MGWRGVSWRGLAQSLALLVLFSFFLIFRKRISIKIKVGLSFFLNVVGFIILFIVGYF